MLLNHMCRSILVDLSRACLKENKKLDWKEMVKFLGYIHRNAEKTFKKVLRKFQGSVNEFLLDYKEIVLEVSKKNQESVNDVL